LLDFFRGWWAGVQRIGHTTTFLFNTVFLSIAYFVGVGPTSLVARAVRKRFLEKDIDPKAATYWSDRNLTTEPLDKYRRQF
jgi:hypothetical protein